VHQWVNALARCTKTGHDAGADRANTRPDGARMAARILPLYGTSPAARATGRTLPTIDPAFERRPVRMAKKPPAATAASAQTMIAEAAYYRAERRGFIPGFAMEDWLAAEHEVLVLLRKTRPSPVRSTAKAAPAVKAAPAAKPVPAAKPKVAATGKKKATVAPKRAAAGARKSTAKKK